MDCAKIINELKEKHKVYIKANIDLECSYHDAEKGFEKLFLERWKERFAAQPVLFFASGYKAEGFLPSLCVYRIQHNGQLIYFRSDGVFCGANDERKVIEVDGISVAEIDDFARDFQEEVGLPVEVNKKKVRTKDDIERIRTREDLEIYYEDRQIEVVSSGEIWYVGWDISDPYFLIRLDGKKEIHVFYATNGHGFGVDEEVEPHDQEALDKFLRYIDNNEAGTTPSQIGQQVLKSWE